MSGGWDRRSSEEEVARVIKQHDDGPGCTACEKGNPDRCLTYRMALDIRGFRDMLTAVVNGMESENRRKRRPAAP